MLQEFALLLETTPPDAGRADYVSVVVDDNCLGKRTVSNRRLSLQRLTELYGLDRRRLLFRVLRDLWELHDANRPLLALLLGPDARPAAAGNRVHRFGHSLQS